MFQNKLMKQNLHLLYSFMLNESIAFLAPFCKIVNLMKQEKMLIREKLVAEHFTGLLCCH